MAHAEMVGPTQRYQIVWFQLQLGMGPKRFHVVNVQFVGSTTRGARWEFGHVGGSHFRPPSVAALEPINAFG
jgi:hypothetical protein